MAGEQITPSDIARTYDAQDLHQRPEVDLDNDRLFGEVELKDGQVFKSTIEPGVPLIIGKASTEIEEESLIAASKIKGVEPNGIFLKPEAGKYPGMSERALLLSTDGVDTLAYKAGKNDMVFEEVDVDGNTSMEIVMGSDSIRDMAKKQPLAPEEIADLRSRRVGWGSVAKIFVHGSNKHLSTVEISIGRRQPDNAGIPLTIKHREPIRNPYGSLDYVTKRYSPRPPESIFIRKYDEARNQPH